MTCSLFHGHNIRVMGELLIVKDMVGSVSRWAGWEVPQERKGGSGQIWEGTLPKTHGVIRGEGLMGPLQRLILTSRVLFYLQLPIVPSEKEAKKRKSAYKEGPRLVVAPQDQHLSPHPAICVWCPLPHRFFWCCPRHGHPPGEISGCLKRGVGRQGQALQFISGSHTLGLRN